MYRIKLSANAIKDLEDAKKWYGERSVLAQKGFVNSISNSFFHLQKNPLAFPKRLKSLHAFPMLKFPFTIYYQIENQSIVIVAVLHQSRDNSHLPSDF